MNEYERLYRIAENLKVRYPKGTRIEVISMGEDPRPIPSGTRGTVEVVDDMATVHCTFDNGRYLGLAYGEDHFRVLTPQECYEEKMEKDTLRSAFAWSCFDACCGTSNSFECV